MMWVVDTCVILDILEDDPTFGMRSARCLEDRLAEGLMVCPVTMVELAPAFGGNMAEQRKFLQMAGISYEAGWTSVDTEAAYQAWAVHISLRRIGHVPKRPLADIGIGAFALNRRGLITRNTRDFRRNFPDLEIVEP